MTKELTKYQITFLKTTEKASLIYQQLKKRKNGCKKSREVNKKKRFFEIQIFKQRIEKQVFFSSDHKGQVPNKIRFR